ncbi:MAG: response regulator [Gammaproteobacteria bacterium]|nr:response regulator [Gammaproteobacteria bacterium]
MAENISENQVLVVDDSRVIRRAAVKILQKDFDVIEAEDGEVAWDELQKNPKISVVFSDLGMPNMDGFELLEKIRNAQDPVLAKVPVIIITGAEETDGTKEEVLQQGATDFISKPFDSISLKTRASAHINYRNEVKSLEKSASLDKLTGLSTESSFSQQGEKTLAYAKRHCTEVTLVRFDIDHFAEVFVKHGKEIAEQILAKVASLINEGKRTEDIAARLGVSRFALLLPSSDPQGAEILVRRICQRVARLKLKMGQDVFNIQFSTGITSPALDDTDIAFSELLNQAEKALKKAVNGGGGKIVKYQSLEVSAKVAPAKADIKENIDLSLDELITKLSHEESTVSNEQLASAMRKILPLITHADSKLKLGLSKVVLHLKKRLYH